MSVAPGRPDPRLEPDPLELRADPRTGTDIAVQIQAQGLPGTLPARARDLSVGGACIATATPFAAKAIERVQLALPDGPLTLVAEGRWQRALRHDDMVMTGVAFCNAPHAAVDRLWDTVLDAGKQLARFIYLRSEIPGLGLDGAMGLAQLTRYREVADGAPLYRQGPAESGERSIFLVAEGKVSLRMRVRNARDTVVASLERGAVFGGMPLLAGGGHSETALAEGPTRLLEIQERSFAHVVRHRPWLAQCISQAVTAAYARRLHAILERVADRL